MTWEERYGNVASTWASETGPIGSVSLASVRPFFSAPTARKPCQTTAGRISFSAAHLKSARIRLIPLLAVLRAHPLRPLAG
jgi:hypothetical protein